jgi:hypothetical protein
LELTLEDTGAVKARAEIGHHLKKSLIAGVFA